MWKVKHLETIDLQPEDIVDACTDRREKESAAAAINHLFDKKEAMLRIEREKALFNLMVVASNPRCEAALRMQI
jgi:hypothetical protein